MYKYLYFDIKTVGYLKNAANFAPFLSYTEPPICTAFFARPAYPRIMTDTLLKEKSVN